MKTPEVKDLFILLAKHGGSIVSTASLHPNLINQARASNRMYVDENSLGYVWEPPIAGRFPENQQEIEMFEWCYPLDVELPEDLISPQKIFDKIDQEESESASLRQEVERLRGERSIMCPYCNGDGYTPEHNDHSPYEPCNQCPIQVPCGYCFASGKVTTEIMKQHINESKTDVQDVLDLPF